MTIMGHTDNISTDISKKTKRPQKRAPRSVYPPEFSSTTSHRATHQYKEYITFVISIAVLLSNNLRPIHSLFECGFSAQRSPSYYKLENGFKTPPSPVWVS